MSLNGIQTYIKGVLDGLPMPYPQEQNLAAYIQPPAPVDQTTPVAFIWGAKGKEIRKAGPRKFGIKHDTVWVEVWLYYAEDASDPDADSLFPAVIDSVKAALRSIPIPAHPTDPTTQAKFTILDIADDIELDYAGTRALADQRYLQYEALLKVKVIEGLQA